MDLLSHAIRYADSGFPVFPCIPHSKKPLTQNGFHDATTDTDQIIEWWEAEPNANIAIATAGLVVIDVDGADNTWLQDQRELYSKLGENAICVTPRGGTHYWFAQLDGEAVDSSVGRIAPNVDIRANGGYVVVPPSVIDDDGKGIHGQYNWVATQRLSMRSELTPIPDWLLQLIRDGKRTESIVLPGELQIGEGQRNASLTRLAGVVRRYGAGEGEIRAFLRAINWNRCDPPLDNTEVDIIARSVSRYAPDQCASAYGEGWDGQEEQPESIDPGDIPADLLTVPGLIGDVMSHNLATAFKPQPELALAAGLCLLSVLTGRKVEDSRGTRTNLYAFGIAESGAGKDHARKLNKQILTAIGAEELIGAEGFASHAGVVSSLEETPSRLFQIDEFGRLLKTLKNPASSPHLYHIVSVLLKLYSSANSQFVGDAYSDKSKLKRINQPHAVLYGTTVPQSFFEGLTFESLSDGFLSRTLCFFSSNNFPEPGNPEACELLEAITGQARAWWDFRPGGNLSGENPQPLRVPTTTEAAGIFAQVEYDCRQRQQNKQDDCATMWTRVEEKSRTLALLYACSRDGIEPVIDEDAATWGATLVEHLTLQLTHKSQGWITRGQHDAAIKEVYRAIESSGANGMTKNQLLRKFQHLRRQERDEILSVLIESGRVSEVTQKQNLKGRPATVYIALRFAK